MDRGAAMRRLCRAGGFTFIELIVTLAIMGVLATVAVPMAQVSIQRDKERELRLALQEIRLAIDAYKRASDNGSIKVSLGDSGFPKTLEELTEGVPDQRHPQKRALYFLRRIPRDPFAPPSIASASDTWAKRAYSSPPDNPMEGNDVFDVASRSPLTGLNGIPLKAW